MAGDGRRRRLPQKRARHGAASGVGEETLAGRATIKYALTSPKGAAGIAPALKFMVKFEAADGSVMELRNITEEPQPEALFTVPPEFRKYDVSRLIKRVKRSDGWVEPMK